MTLPPTLFKYRGVDEPLRHILEGRTLWFSRVGDFNDPFDCAPDIYSAAPPAMVSKTIRRVISRNANGAPRNQRRLEARRLEKTFATKSLGSPEGDELVRAALQKSVDMAGVLSLSEKDDDVLMWSHYGHGHRGVCLEFSTDLPPFSTALEVRYSRERPRINPLIEKTEAINQAVLVKADYWSYEKEWRCLVHKYSGPIDFMAKSLKSITLGAKATAEDQAKIRQWAMRGGLAPRWRRASFDPHEFRLNITEA